MAECEPPMYILACQAGPRHDAIVRVLDRACSGKCALREAHCEHGTYRADGVCAWLQWAGQQTHAMLSELCGAGDVASVAGLDGQPNCASGAGAARRTVVVEVTGTVGRAIAAAPTSLKGYIERYVRTVRFVIAVDRIASVGAALHAFLCSAATVVRVRQEPLPRPLPIAAAWLRAAIDSIGHARGLERCRLVRRAAQVLHRHRMNVLITWHLLPDARKSIALVQQAARLQHMECVHGSCDIMLLEQLLLSAADES
jgi:hypothetical protein